MKLVLVCPQDDVIEIGSFDLHNENRIYASLVITTFRPEEPPLYPYVPAYFQSYNQQRQPLMRFLRENNIRAKDYLLVLHDDATDLEAHALSELLIACGAKSTLMEYRAFLLSSEEAYIAVTGSKRAVTVTMVQVEKEDTERIFLPIADVTPELVQECIHDLDPTGRLPVYRYGVGGALSEIGEPVNTNELVRNFVKIL